MELPKASLSFSEPLKLVHLAGQGAVARFSADDLTKAREEARQEASQAVTLAYDSEIAKLKDDVSTVVEKVLKDIVQQHADALEEMRCILPVLVKEAVSRIVGSFQWDDAAIKGVVADLLSEVAPGAENVEVQLCRGDMARVEQFQNQFRQKFPSLRFEVNEELHPGDCMVKTKFGTLDGRLATKIKAVEGLLT
jgi:flagellar assembly protein FliH